LEPLNLPPADQPWPEQVRLLQDKLRAEGQERIALAKLVLPLSKEKAFSDLKKLSALVSKIQAKLEGQGEAADGTRALLTHLGDWIATAPDTMRLQTGRGLKESCEARGLELIVERKEAPVLLRIPPVAVEIDFALGKATILFAKFPVIGTTADADSIMAARDRLLATWDEKFDATVFHEACRKAWRGARAAHGIEEERVEILKFLPYLALQLQSEKFSVEPEAKNFRGYGRARFAYDVNRLREQRALEQNGWRLSLGVATGSTAQQKKRVIYFENGRGEGEYKLTVSFTRAEGRS
jgi:hypothetical protein